MQTSKLSSRIFRIIFGVLVAVVVNVGLSFALEPYGGYAEFVWSEYRAAQDENFDTVFIGSSYAARSLNPYAIDEALGSTSFNFGTTAQSLNNSYYTLQRTLKDHDIKRVILGIGYTPFPQKTWPNSDLTSTQAMSVDLPLHEKIGNYLRLLTNPLYRGWSHSVALLFPWTLNHVSYSPHSILNNIKARLSGDQLQAFKNYMPSFEYVGHGFSASHSAANFDTLDFGLVGNFLDGREFREDNLASLAAICKLCQEQDIELYVVVTPTAAFQQLSLGEQYPQNMGLVQRVVEENGATYFDCNLLKPEVYHPERGEFFDEDHLNLDGANRFAPIFGGIIRGAETGQDVSGYFFSYEQWNEYLRSIDYIALVRMSASVPQTGTVELEAHAYAGSTVKVEYQFVRLLEDGSQEVLRDWSPEAQFSWQPTDAHGNAQVRVNVRQAGNSCEWEHYHSISVMY